MNEETQTPESFERLKRSIERHGVLVPIIVHKHTGKVLDGHHRLEIANALALEDVPVIVWPWYGHDNVRQEIEKYFRALGDKLMEAEE